MNSASSSLYSQETHGDIAHDFNQAIQKTKDMQARLQKTVANFLGNPKIARGINFTDESSGLGISINASDESNGGTLVFGVSRDGESLSNIWISKLGIVDMELLPTINNPKPLKHHGAKHLFFQKNEIPRILDSFFRKMTQTSNSGNVVGAKKESVSEILKKALD